MHLASKFMLSRAIKARSSCRDAGFSIVEGLIASVIVALAVAATAGGFNLVTSSIRGTAEKNTANLSIDNDVSRIKKLSAEYSACVTPAGGFPGNGCDVGSDISHYYFPMDPLKVDQFFAACNGAAGAHITANFVDALKNLGEPAPGVSRAVARENGGDPKNHNVIVRYTADGKESRVLKVAPVVSAWCG
jgi:hypothetical protein